VSKALRFALLGNPVVQSIVPAIHRAALSDLCLPHSFEAVNVPDPVRLEAMVEAVRQGVFGGAVVTLPYKEGVLSMVESVAPSAELAQSANVLVREGGKVVAHNTEAAALADDLVGLGATGRAAAVIGSGGGALMATIACGAIGAKVVAVTSRSWISSEGLVDADTAERFRALGALPCTWPTAGAGYDKSSKMSAALRLQWPDFAAGSSIIVQATSAGMRGRDPGSAVAQIVPWARLNKDALLYDLVYTPTDTPFLRAARERGLRAAGGLGMLVRQAAHALSLWLNVNPNIDLMRLAAEQAMLVGIR
jgi:shikimate dehydrogenase